MLQSNHDIDFEYGQDLDASQDVDDAIKDIDVSPLVFFAQKCIPCCCHYRDIDDIDDRSYFSETTLRLISSQRGGGTTNTVEDERTAERSRIRPRVLVNKNVFLHFILRFVQGTADSLWRGTVLSIFVVQLTTDSNGRSDYFRFAGYLEGMFGLGKIIAGMLYPDDAIMKDNLGGHSAHVSRQQRQHMRDEINHTPGQGRQNSFTLKCAGVILLLTAISNIIILATLSNEMDYQLFYQLLMPVLLFYGYSSSVLLSSSASHALLPKPKNEQYHKTERSITLTSSMVGPLISIVIFATVGNSYTIRNLKAVWYVGCGLEGAVGFLSLCFSERYLITSDEEEEDGALEGSPVGSSRDEGHALDNRSNGIGNGDDDIEEEDGVDESVRELQQKIDRVLSDEKDLNDLAAPVRQTQQSASNESPLVEPLLPWQPSHTLGEDASAAPITADDIPTNKRQMARLIPLLTNTLLVASVLLFVAGSALFHPYWPIFFKDIPQLPPIQLQTLYALVPFLLLLCDSAYQAFTWPDTVAYRVAIYMAARFLGASMIMLIGTAGYWGGGSSSVFAILFTLRMVFMDSNSVIKVETVFIGYVSNVNHPLWKQGMKMAVTIIWSVCAALGGAIVESKSIADHGYGDGYAFVQRLAGILEFVGMAFMIMVVFFIHVSKHWNNEYRAE